MAPSTARGDAARFMKSSSVPAGAMSPTSTTLSSVLRSTLMSSVRSFTHLSLGASYANSLSSPWVAMKASAGSRMTRTRAAAMSLLSFMMVIIL